MKDSGRLTTLDAGVAKGIPSVPLLMPFPLEYFNRFSYIPAILVRPIPSQSPVRSFNTLSKSPYERIVT